MRIILSIILPIAAIIACAGIFLYSKTHHTWEATATVAVIIAIALAVGTLSQGLGGKLESDRDSQERKQEHEDIRINQDRNYALLVEMAEKVDNIDNRLSTNETGTAEATDSVESSESANIDENVEGNIKQSDNKSSEVEPSDETTAWVVKNRTDVIYKKDIFLVDIKVRKAGEKTWKRAIEADVDDIIEFQAEYCNRGKEIAEDIMVRSILPTNMEYVEDSTRLYNSNYQDGVEILDNTVTTSGINIGDYNYQGNAYVRFQTRIIDLTLAEGNNQLITWATITQNNEALYYDASVFVMK